MPALGNRSSTFLGLGLLAAALCAPSSPAQARTRILRPGANGRVVRVVPFADLTDEELLRRAAAAGPRRVRGGEHLSGRVFAQGLRFEGAGEVTIEPGTEIFSHGDIVVDAPIVARRTTSDFRLKKGGAGAPVGASGGDGRGLVLTCDLAGEVVVNQPIQLEDGEAGGDVTVTGPSGQGGDGGDGGGVHIVCPNKVTISANIAPGRGGRGGFAHVTGNDGGPGQDGETVKSACGGKGGKGGVVEVRAKVIEFTTDVNGKAEGKIALRPGGTGGEATAVGGDGGVTQDCQDFGADGGDATARGGAAGVGSSAVVESKTLLPETFVAKDFSGFDASETSDGGAATARGGKGADGLTCLATGCPEKGRSAAPAGWGGDATAIGGVGGTGGKIGGGKGTLNKRAQAGAEMTPGNGGRATAVGGAGGVAGSGENGKAPGNGGSGGRGGKARATGGMGGSSTLGQKKGVPLADNQGPLKGGNGGVADVLGGDSGVSGNGGDCCENPSHSGGFGGPIVLGGKGFATGGPGGRGHVRGDRGGVIVGDGADGGKGTNGADCPGYFGDGFSCWLECFFPSPVSHGVVFFPVVTLYNPTAVEKTVDLEICCDGRSIAKIPGVVIPAGTEANPGSVTPHFGLFITSKHARHRMSVMVDGKTIKNHYIVVI